jgi:SGT1 protein
MDRIKDFPTSISDNFHRQTVYVPLGVAALLQQNPQLIAPAVQAFCNRDPIDMKACRAMRFFPPENRTYISVLFTKCLYAMITHNSYLPDRRTGWSLPSSASSHFKAHLLGVKIACGFEILASQAKNTTNNIELDKEWQKYVESLTKRNYFQDELEGSKKHQELLEQAKVYYKENRDTMKVTNIIGNDILKNLKQLDINQDEFKLMEESLPESDSDAWLNIAPEELDEMLLKRYGVKSFLEKNSKENAGKIQNAAKVQL